MSHTTQKIKVNIRFLRQGLIKAEVDPSLLTKENLKALEVACSEIMEKLTDDELILAMADFENPSANGYFDEAPYVAAVEDSETTELIATSIEWDGFYDTDTSLKLPDSNNELDKAIQIVKHALTLSEKEVEDYKGGMDEYINSLEDSSSFYNEAHSIGEVSALRKVINELENLKKS